MGKITMLQGLATAGFALLAASACTAQTPAEEPQAAIDRCGPLSGNIQDLSGWGYVFDFSGCVTGGTGGFRFGAGRPMQSSLAAFGRQPGVRLFGDSAGADIGSEGLRIERQGRNYLHDGGRLDRQNYRSPFGSVSLRATAIGMTPYGASSAATLVEPRDRNAAVSLRFRLADRRPDSLFAWSFRLRAASRPTQIRVRADDGRWRTISLSPSEWTPVAISPRHDGDRETAIEIDMSTDARAILWDRGQLEIGTIARARCDSPVGRAYRDLGTFTESVHNNNCSYLAATSWMGGSPREHCDISRRLPPDCFARREARPVAIDLHQRSRLAGSRAYTAALADQGTIVAVWRPRAAYLGAGTVYEWRDCIDTGAGECVSGGTPHQDYRNLNWRVAGSPYQFQVGAHSSSRRRGSDGLNVHRVPFHTDAAPARPPGDLYRVGDAAYELPWQLAGRALPDNIVQDNRINIAAHSWHYSAALRSGRHPRATRIIALNGRSRVHQPRLANSSIQQEMDRLTFGARADGTMPVNGEILAILILDRACSAAALEAFSRGDLTLPRSGQVIDPMNEQWCAR